jgi:hypothetical protein
VWFVLHPARSLSPLIDERGVFDRPRIIGGLLLLAAVAVLVLIDAVSLDYAADTVLIALLLGTASVLLGVEGLRSVLDRQR